ncbi:MAG: hypothetical protein U0163_20045, partial [Gemmatimonadaceae bacterium]
VLQYEDSGGRRLRVTEIEAGTTRPYDVDWRVANATASPDGRWVFCWCAFRADEPMLPLVFPADRPRRFRRIQHTVDASDGVAVWLRYSHAALPATIAVDTGWRHVTVGVPHLLSSVVYDSLRRSMPAGQVTWTVASGDARIESPLGILRASGPGRIALTADAGNAVQRHVDLEASQSAVATVFEENWSDTAMSRWYRVGWPDPVVVTLRDGTHAFLNNGDGSYKSSSITRVAFDLEDGLAIDLTVSTRITLLQWQQLRLALLANIDTARYARARGHNVTPHFENLDQVCDASWPFEDSNATGSARTLELSVRADGRNVRLPERVLNGAWYQVRLQLFPDGRCGLALDHTPVAVLPTPAAWHATAHLELGGSSRDTQVLIGAVRIRRGVPTDIDWSRLLSR